MERHYKAFISYRHLPLDIQTAKKIHRRIERYVIPKALRKNGEKKLGYVFRDQDELPISSNLSANIQEALDRAEYLIVICTPETQKSAWVMREISYFIETHDREHVLAVLADGEPSESFPPQLTEVRGENGDLLEHIEPLAANIVADTAARRSRLFQTESLRILAALIGCPYDALFRRELRYRRRKVAAVISAAGLIAAAFIGMLLNRNAQIRNQLEQTQKNESTALAALSQNAYREGDYSGALQYALDALPSEEDERPYMPQAEYALSQALDLYRKGILSYFQSIDLETTISILALSADGSRMATADAHSALQLFDVESGRALWTRSVEAPQNLFYLDGPGAVLVSGENSAAAYRAEDGELLWQRDDISAINLSAVSADGCRALVISIDEGSADYLFSLLDLTTGQSAELRRFPGDLFQGVTAVTFSPDGQRVAFLSGQDEMRSAALYLFSLSSGELLELDRGLPFSMGAINYRLLFLPKGDLALACDNRHDESFISCYAAEDGWAPRWTTPVETEKQAQMVSGFLTSFGTVDFFSGTDTALVMGSKHFLYMLDPASGEIRWAQQLPAYLLQGQLYINDCMVLAMSDGTVTFCTESGQMGYTQDIDCFRGGFDTVMAHIAGYSFVDGSFVLVPNDSRQRAVILRYQENPDMSCITTRPEQASRLVAVSSPSGALTAALGYNPIGEPVTVTILHQNAELPLSEFDLPEDGAWDDPGQLYLTESGVLISPRCAMSCRDGSVAVLSPEGLCVSASSQTQGLVFTSCVEAEDGRYTLRSWINAEPAQAVALPEELQSWQDCTARCVCVSPGGLAAVELSAPEAESRFLVYSPASGEWTELDEGLTPLAAAEDRLLLACLDGEDRVHMLDMDSGRELFVSAPLPPATAHTLFACDDGYLLLFSEAGTLSILSTGTGELLHSSSYGNFSLYFPGAKTHYAARLTADGRRLLVFCDTLSLDNPMCLSIDTADWVTNGVYTGVASYESENSTLLVFPFCCDMYRSHLWSLSEMMEKAASVTGQDAPQP